MQWDSESIIALITATGIGGMWRPILRLITGQTVRRERDILGLQEKLEHETGEVKAILLAQIAELRGQVVTLTAQNIAQQQMIMDQHAQIAVLQEKAKIRN